MPEIVLKVSMHCKGYALHDFWRRRFLLGFLVIFFIPLVFSLLLSFLLPLLGFLARMVMHTSPIGVDGYRDKVVTVDFWFFLFVQVCVGSFLYICLN